MNKTLITFIIFTTFINALSLDDKLNLIISVHELKAKKITNTEYNTSIELGKIFFESKILSGTNNMSCLNCHLDKFGSADGLPLAVGVNGEGEGISRYKHGKGILVQRNALSLIGRSDKKFKSFFWDGKVEDNGSFIFSQFGNSISKKFTSTLSVAAVMPILERDELMGEESFFTKNKIADEVKDQLYQKKYNAISKVLKERIYSSETNESIQIQENLKLLKIEKNDFELALIGNFIADFIKYKFHMSTSRFDKYIEGNKNILTKDEKQGAILFFGKGKCSYCHQGNLFSDFTYHSIGTPQGYFGVHSRHRDLGRAGVTNKVNDIYKFRTPPLIEVSKTSPYGHNGAFPTLYDIILHHMNPIQFYIKNSDYAKADYFTTGKLLNSRDKILSIIDIDKEEEINKIIFFLETI